MNKFFLAFCVMIVCTGCSNEDTEPGIENPIFVEIENISFDNYPRVDGSTSTSILSMMVACNLLDVSYRWMEPGIFTDWTLQPIYNDLPEQHKDFFGERVKSSRTHGAFMNLIDGNADIILTHRTISANEKVHADAAGVTLIETPVASDAFVFVVNINNPVKSLTVSQIQKIYTGEITNWSQVGGKDASIKVFTRPRDSGSEEVLRELVMDGIEPAEFPESGIGGMSQVFSEIFYNDDAICYTFNNYKNMQARVPDSEVPKISINNIFPDEETIKNETFPFISKVYVAIRSDLDHNSMAYKLYEFLQTDDAKPLFKACGFITK